MPSFAKRALAFTFFAVLLLWGVAAPAVAQAPLRLTDAVRLEISREWGVGADSITVELRGITDSLPECCERVRLGGGSAGWRTGIVWPTGGKPRSFRFRAAHNATVPAATRELHRGDTLQAADIQLVTRLVWGPPAEIQTVEPGWLVRSKVVPGEQLAYPDVAPPPLVQSGEAVSVEVQRGSVTVSLSGTAIGAAGPDEVTQVRLAGGRGIVRGRAVARGLVVIETSARADWTR